MNIGDADRTARLLIGAAMGFLFLTQRVSGTIGLVLGIISPFLLTTSLIGWCPFYAMFRISTQSPGDAPFT